MACHRAWVMDRPGVWEERDPGDYDGRHRLEQIFSMSEAVHKLVFWNEYRGGFQRARGAEMIR